ncbi:MAG TPA: DNA polymerase/3'-5' exonuclease PolX [Egibacteraceae bacterium]|nr:DNA polymerase/3'-5' exonuclease PolX [Egibacteraceae bacterium]
MGRSNDDVARQLAEISSLLRLAGEDRFRVRAYERAAGAVAAVTEDVSGLSREQLGRLKGVGPSIAAKIAEYLSTGRIGMLDQLRASVPPGLLELTRIPGVGPKTARQLHDALGIDSLDALREALAAERLRDLPGLGARSEANLREAVAGGWASGESGRVPAAEAIAVAQEMCARLRRLPEVREVTWAGSLRRMSETVGDVDLLAASTEPGPVMAAFRDSYLVARVVAAGAKKTSVITVRGIQADLRVVDPAAWGAALVYFTGSKAHNVRVRERAVRQGLMLNEYGLFRRGSGTPVASRSEADVYAALDLDWIPPPMREDTGEVEAAAGHRLPRVVACDDLRGDLHGHSDWSGDGKATLEAMAAAAAARGYAYWAATDHAENLPINGLSRDQVLARRDEIARLQERHQMRILDGAELNIGAQGTLDYDPDFLLGFDFCVASVHSLMRRPAAQQTQRIIEAMHQPVVNVIGHPTGRLIGRRPGYDIDVDAILQAAADTGTALEVNASLRRLDLSGDLVRRAVDRGVTLAISSDAHSVGELATVGYGVATAQRGWATPDLVLNCRDLAGLLAFVSAKRAAGRW